MRTLTRYLFVDMLRPTLVTLFVMLAIIWLMQSLRFMDYIINRGLNVADFVMMTVFLVPSLLVQVLPISFFIGCCFAFKRLQEDSELDALFASGRSRVDVAWPSILSALLFVGIGYVNAFWVLPVSQGQFKTLQYDLRNSRSSLLLEEGTFAPMGKHLTVYVQKRDDNGTLHNLLVYDNSKADQPVTWIADSGVLARNPDGSPQLLLDKAARLEVSDRKLYTLAFDHASIDIMPKAQPTGVRWKKADERTLGELLSATAADVGARNVYMFHAEIMRRLVWPLSPLPLMLIAAVFLIRDKKSRGGSLTRMLSASVVVLVYLAALTACYSLSSDGMESVLYGQLAVPLGTVVVCLMLLRGPRPAQPAWRA